MEEEKREMGYLVDALRSPLSPFLSHTHRKKQSNQSHCQRLRISAQKANKVVGILSLVASCMPPVAYKLAHFIPEHAELVLGAKLP